VLVFQSFSILISLWISFLLRFDFSIPDSYALSFYKLIVPALFIKLLILRAWRLHRGWWRTSVGLPDMLTLFKANLSASAGLIVFVALFYRMESIPRSILAFDGFLCFVFLSAGRFSRRTFQEHVHPFFIKAKGGSRALIIGGGAAGTMLAREIRQNPTISSTRMIGFVDDDPLKLKTQILGYPVLGKTEDISHLVQRFKIDELIIAVPSASPQEMLRIVELCRESKVPYKTIPTLSDLLQGNVLLQLKPVEVNDLLHRDVVKLDDKQINSYLRGKRVLVTGAAGSIGSELCRQIAKHTPSALILVDNAETPLFHINNALTEAFPGLNQSVHVASIRCQQRLENLFMQQRPDVVFHAAAYKHVPLMELNPEEAVCTNVIGTRNVVEASVAAGVSHFVMISTDKAVHPTSVMGATKRLAEMTVQAYSKSTSTHFITVRFGNVLGSRGSVIPTFVEQIKNGGPVTVTDPDITRFFMTIPEASQLVLQAGGMGKGGEIFILDMGEPVRILTLAEELIRLSGYEPYKDIDIVFTGLRAGEKMYEELLLEEETLTHTPHPKIMVASAATLSKQQLTTTVEKLCQFCQKNDTTAMLNLVKETAPEYQPEAKESIRNEKH